MPWKLTALFTSRPYISGTVSMDYATSMTVEYVGEDGKPTMPPHPRRYSDEEDGFRPTVHSGNVGHPRTQTLTYPHSRNQTPAGSFPDFSVPKSDGTFAQDVIDDADQEGYAAYLESGVSPAEAMSPYPTGSILARAWKNGYARADHQDARSDTDDGV